MKLITREPLTYDGRSYGVGDVFDVADDAIAESILACGRASRAPEAAPEPEPTPPTPHAPPANHRKHK